MNVDQVYKTVKELLGHLDEICEYYIIYLVGFEGFHVLLDNGFLERRGVVNGQRTYALCDDEIGDMYGRRL